jgi:hypothetical protein
MSSQSKQRETIDCSQDVPDDTAQRLALQQRAHALGATAEQLAAALEELALHTEVVLRRLRGASIH